MKTKPIILLNTDCIPKNSSCAFTINEAYPNAVYEAGGLPFLMPPLKDITLTDISKLANFADAFVFIGGRDYPSSWYGEEPHPANEELVPQRARFDIELAKIALESGKPLLGICGGHQLIWIALGGGLLQHVTGHRPVNETEDVYHNVAIEADSQILSKIFSSRTIVVKSLHHQAVNPDKPADGVKICAWAEDGTPEAFEGIGKRFLLGVQWHPERINSAEH
ncbi:MAG: gamma-glutamyl-gamma-aminobutyrate hydrolase family protein, partial [Candidatus Nanoarchaeia archaeon]